MTTLSALPARLDLRGWNLYFLGKFVLAWMGVLQLHVLPNLALLLALLVPLKAAPWRVARSLVALPFAAASLYQDTWWPPFRRLLAQPDVLDFSAAYLWELALRFVSVPVLAALGVLLVAWWLLKPWLRMTTLSVLGMLVVAAAAIPRPAFLAPPGSAAPTLAANPGAGAEAPASNAVLDAWLTAFHRQQAQLATRFPPLAANAPPFDVIVLNICSLAWSDLDEVDMRDNALLEHMDVVFDRFNSATSYSGPAAIRLLRASCGQAPNADLYEPAEARCFLFQNLERLGFRAELAMNHDGHFDDFIGDLARDGGLAVASLDTATLPRALLAFDGTPLHRDSDVLGRWLAQREHGQDDRVALFYNTISLHDGNRLLGADGRARSAGYRERAEQVLGDIDAFIGALERDGRRALVLVVPEHGAALRGDRMQIPGMREIPSLAITEVPAAVKLVNLDVAAGGLPRHVSQPSSYLALSELVARLYAAEAGPAGPRRTLDELLHADGGLPTTPAVSENAGATVIEYAGKPWLRQQGSAEWIPYPEAR